MIIKGTPICVDQFTFIPGISIYLLSHMHTDHITGLKPSWNFGKIYCSKISKELLLDKFSINPDFVIALNENETLYIPIEESKKNKIQITLIDVKIFFN
jgi:mRNA degradation ribonuclease J1/J2